MTTDARMVSVAVPVAVDSAFTYQVPAAWPHPPAPGTRVLVPFGPRALVGVVRPGTPPAPERGLRGLLADLDDGVATLPADVVELCEWLSDYYIAPIGECYRLALPGLMANADARIAALTEAGEAARNLGGPLLGGAVLDAPDAALLAAIAEGGAGGLSVARLTRIKPKIPNALRRLAALQDRGLALVRWDDAGTQSRTETHLRRTDYLRGGDEARLQEAVGRSKQRRALLDYLEGRDWIPIGDVRGPFPRVRQLLVPLVEARLVATQERPRDLDPFAVGAPEASQPQEPTADQATALGALRTAVAEGGFASALLHGVTGSGKTEVYLQVIADLRARGRGAIVLVPEIALTPQLADRFRARFGDAVAVLHSGLTPRQRLDAWQQIRAAERTIAIGPRSAVFAPVPELGVIVVDEEHDPSFKQEDGVRYNARDVALVRGRNAGALVILGSATPALETHMAAERGRHVRLELRERPTPRPLPTVEIIPLSVHRPDPESMLTGALRTAVLETVRAGEQAILFLNRRGYTTTLCCDSCGAFQHCPDCSAPSMTYHLARNRLMCHLCGFIDAAPTRCPECGSTVLVHGGVGTERVEVSVAKSLGGARVLRLDRDATRGRQLLDTLSSFRRREADVLVGTQMLSKGHDFPGVTLVGILQGDHGLALPDPRSAERTFQLLTQVAGRAGRGDRPGRVLIQAYAITHPAIVFAAQHDYAGFARVELEAREKLGNPPFGHLALVRVQGLDPDRVKARAESLARALRGKKAPVELLGPVPSPIERINRRTRWQMLLRARERAPLRWLVNRLRSEGLLGAGSGPRATSAIVDIDPQSLL